MTKYEKFIEAVKNSWIGLIAIIIIMILINFNSVSSGFREILRIFTLDAIPDTLKSIPPYIEDNSGERIVFDELLISRDIDFIRINAYTYDLMIPAQYMWIKSRYPDFDKYPRTHGFGGISVDGSSVIDEESQQIKCSDKVIYVDSHRINVSEESIKTIVFDISIWKDRLCANSPSGDFSEIQKNLDKTIKKFYDN